MSSTQMTSMRSSGLLRLHDVPTIFDEIEEGDEEKVQVLIDNHENVFGSMGNKSQGTEHDEMLQNYMENAVDAKTKEAKAEVTDVKKGRKSGTKKGRGKPGGKKGGRSEEKEGSGGGHLEMDKMMNAHIFDETDDLLRQLRFTLPGGGISSLEGVLLRFRPALAPATQKQNDRLTDLLRLLNGQAAAEAYAAQRAGQRISRDAVGGYEFDTLGMTFDKNLADTQKLIDSARGLNENKNPDALNSEILNNIPATGGDEKKKKRTNAGGDQMFPNIVSSGMNAPTMFDTGPPGVKKNNSIGGRKPMRLIAAELAKRLELLKTNQAEWEAFQHVIAQYKAEEAGKRVHNRNAIRDNIIVIPQLLPDVHKTFISKMSANRNNHEASVLEKKARIDQEVLNRKLESIHRKEAVIGMERHARKEKEQLSRLHSVQRRWLVLIALGSKLCIIRRQLELSFEEHVQLVRKNCAARVIQRAWKQYRQAHVEVAKVAAFAVIGKAFRNFMRVRRLRKKHQAGDILRNFLLEVHDVSKLMRIIKKYRFSVVKAQRITKQFLKIRKAQMKLVSLQWDKYEPIWWQQRKGKNEGKNISKDDQISKNAKSKGKMGTFKKSDDAKVPLRVPESVKEALILDNLLKRRKQHRQSVAEHKIQMEAYSITAKKRLELTNTNRVVGGDAVNSDGPKRPVWHTLLGQEAMFSLIEKGVLEVTSSKLATSSWGLASSSLRL